VRFHSSHTRAVHTRDAALGKLTRINRLLIAGSVTLTAVLADLAAHAFPGRTLNARTRPSASAANGIGGSDPTASSEGASTQGGLRPPPQAPTVASQSTSESANEPTNEPGEYESGYSETAEEPEAAVAASSEPAAAEESAAASETTSAPESTATQESTYAQEPAPVVSGGS
jgi:hypothetical protein